MLQGSLFGSVIRPGIYRQASRVGSVSGRQFHAFSQIPTKIGAFSGLIKSSKSEAHLPLSILGLVRVTENVHLPCALSFRSSLHSGEKPEVEEGRDPLEVGLGRNFGSIGYDQLLNRERGNGMNRLSPLENEVGRTHPKPMDFVRGLLRDERPPRYQPEVGAGGLPRPINDVQGNFQGRGYGQRGDPAFYQQAQLESNADIVLIKLMRNNSYVTLTDSKGNRKMSVSAGQVAAKGDQPGRYSGEAAAEYMGRVVKQMKIKSVVVKVSGFTFFRRKKDSILAFKDGYTHSRGDVNPVVYIEDTTRKPHNGCRLPKKRRI